MKIYFYFFAALCFIYNVNANNININSKALFIENKGQIVDQHNNRNDTPKFLLNTNGCNVQLRKSGFSYDLYQANKSFSEAIGLHPTKPEKITNTVLNFHRIDIDFVGANPDCEIVGEDVSDHYLNYASFDVYRVRQYGKVTYKNLYPNIDLEFITNIDTDNPVKFNFILKNGANPEIIKWRYSGSENVKIIDKKIVIITSHGILKEEIPVSFIEEENIEVEVFYTVNREKVFSFRSPLVLSEKNTLIIDPTPELSWGTYFGGGGYDEINKISYNSSKGIYVGGNTESIGSLATSGSFQSTYAGNQDAFVSRFSNTGSRLWTTYYGGASMETGSSVIGDIYGNVYLTGYTFSNSGISTPGAYKTSFNTGFNAEAYLVKFDSSGTRLWGSYYGGSNDDQGLCLALSPNNNYVYLGGATRSSNGIASSNSHQSTYGGGTNGSIPNLDGFFVEFNSNGTNVGIRTYYGGSGWDYIYDIDVDASWNIYFTGYTTSTNNIASAGAFQSSIGGSGDVFVASFSSLGIRRWGTYFGGFNDEGNAVLSVGSLGYIYFGGVKPSSGLSTIGAPFRTLNVGYIAQFSSMGQRQWCSYFPGYVNDIVADGNNTVFLTGKATSNSLLPTFDAYKSIASGEDCFLASFEHSSAYNFGTYYGGTGDDEATSITLGVGNNEIYIAGKTSSSNGIITAGAQFSSPRSGFLAKFSNCSVAIEVKDTILKICEGAPVNISTDTTSTITSYQWQVNNGTGFVDLINDTLYSNVNKNTLGISKMLPSLDGLLYRCIANGACNSADTSGTTKLILVNYPYITSSNLANDTQTVCTNSSIVLNVETKLTGNFYTWQVNSGSGFVNISNGGGYSGASTNALAITSINNVNNYTFRCIVGSQCYEKDTSNTTTVLRKLAPVITSISPASSSTLCPESAITITGIVTGDSLVYGWTVNGILLLSDTFPYSGVNTNSLTIDKIDVSATYNLIATNSCGSVSSANRVFAATTAASPQFSSNTDKTVYAPNSTFFSINVSPANYYTYNWQLDNGNGFTDLVNDSTYSFTVTAQSSNTRLNILSTNVSMNGYLYRCIVSDSCGRTDTSATGMLTVLSTASIITTQPQGGSICSGNSKTLSVIANVSSNVSCNITYQWQRKTGTNSFSHISGATNSTYSPIGFVQGTSVTYRCLVSCGVVSVASDEARVSVYDELRIIQEPADVTVCATNPIAVTVSIPPNGITGGYNHSYRWRTLTRPYTDGTNIYGETVTGSGTPTMTVVNPNLKGIGQCRITDGCTGDQVTTRYVYWDSIPIPDVTFQLPKKHFCVDDSAFSLSGGLPLGGTYRLTSNNSVITSFNPSQRGQGQYIISYRYAGNNNCSNIKYDTIFVGASFNPPTVTQVGNDLFSSSLSDNQWYRNGIMLIGEDNNFLSVDEDGDYYTVVTNNGCSKMSNIVSVSVDVSINEFKSNDDWVHLHPNPADKLIYISSSMPEIQEITIYDPLGKVVLQQKHSSMVLDISNLSGGSYIVVISSEKFLTRKRIVKI